MSPATRVATRDWMLSGASRVRSNSQHSAVATTLLNYRWMAKIGCGLWCTADLVQWDPQCGLTMVVARLALTPVALSRLGERRTILFGMVNMFASGIVYQFITQGWEMYLMLMFLPLGSVTIPTLIAALSREAPASDQGELQGSLMGVQSAAGIIGPPIGTALFAYFVGPSAPFAWPAAPFMLSCVFIAVAFVAMLRVPLALRDSVPAS